MLNLLELFALVTGLMLPMPFALLRLDRPTTPLAARGWAASPTADDAFACAAMLVTGVDVLALSFAVLGALFVSSSGFRAAGGAHHGQPHSTHQPC